MEQLDNMNSLLWHLVRKFFSHKINTLNTQEDLMSEARITAAKAIASYDVNNKSSLKTYVYKCVQNRLININNKEAKKVSITIEDISGYNLDDFEFDISMRKILDQIQYEVYFKCFVEDKSQRETAKEIGISLRAVRNNYEQVLKTFKHSLVC